MAYRATTILPQNGYNRSKDIAVRLKTYLQTRAAQFSSGAQSDAVLSVYFDITRERQALAEIAQIPGIIQYAKDQESDQAYNVASEFSLLIANLDAITNFIFNMYPRDSSGFILDRKLVSGSIEFRQFTAPQLSALTALMQTAANGIS